MNKYPRLQFNLDHDHVPTHWYNILGDLDFEIPYSKKPQNFNPPGLKSIKPQIPISLYKQGVSTERYIKIPEEVRNEYFRWRPTPLFRAYRLEQYLDTPAKIYYKYEGTSPAGSHKLNTAIAQAYYYKKAGINHLTTGTGAGQWGTALSMACKMFDLDLTVYMVKCSYEQKPYRRVLMQMHDAEILASPSTKTNIGRNTLEKDPNAKGSLSIANAEAIEQALEGERSRFSVGSGENHVLLHQTIIGQEAIRQMELTGEYPDIVIACIGAGSNFAGMTFPFMADVIKGSRQTQFLAVEPDACPKLTKGRYAWDYSDYTGITPLLKMYTLGHKFMASPIHAGGLRYHGAAPLISAVYDKGYMDAIAYPQRSVFEAAHLFMKVEKLTPAPESAHAVKGAIEVALEAKRNNEKKVILFNMSGHGFLDLSAYDHYLSGQMQNCLIDDKKIEESLALLPVV
jgi:tryptophan synthase beta chain